MDLVITDRQGNQCKYGKAQCCKEQWDREGLFPLLVQMSCSSRMSEFHMLGRQPYDIDIMLSFHLKYCLNKKVNDSVQLKHIFIRGNAEDSLKMSVQMRKIDESAFGYRGVDILMLLYGLPGMFNLAVQEELVG